MMLYNGIVVPWWSYLSGSSCSSMILRTGSIGTIVNSVFTSYDLTHSSSLSLISLICYVKSLVLWEWCSDLATGGFRILVSSLAVPYATAHVMETKGLWGTPALWIFGSLWNFWDAVPIGYIFFGVGSWIFSFDLKCLSRVIGLFSCLVGASVRMMLYVCFWPEIWGSHVAGMKKVSIQLTKKKWEKKQLQAFWQVLFCCKV